MLCRWQENGRLKSMKLVMVPVLDELPANNLSKNTFILLKYIHLI